MSAEQTIANYLAIAAEDLRGARLLQAAGNRNAAYLAEQAAEKTIRAVLTSEGLHAGIRPDLRAMVDMVPEDNPLRSLLVRTVTLRAYATAFRYPTTRRIPAPPEPDELETLLQSVGAALEAALEAFDVDLSVRRPRAGRSSPVR